MLALYNTVLLPLRLVAEGWSRWPGRTSAGRREWDERLARALPTMTPGGIWVHGSSVGEARLVSTIARAVRNARPAVPLAASAYTPAGRAQLPRSPDVDASFHTPLDFPSCVRRVMGSLRPSVIALVETELWPNLLHEAQRGGVSVVLLNGRLSPHRVPHYRRLSALYRPLLESLARVGAQSPEDAERLTALGAREDRVSVTGNVKYDLPLPDVSPREARDRLRLGERRPVLVAGSTAAGEEIEVLEALHRIRDRHPGVLLILAPRHLSRVAEVERLVSSRGLRIGKLSALPQHGVERLDVLLVDTMGQLFSLYPLASVAFVGGSLVPAGGHNVLEPAAVGVPVLFGPHTDNFLEPAESLEQAGGGFRVVDAKTIAERVTALLDDSGRRDAAARRAAAVVDSNRGALARSLSLLFEQLDRPGSTTPGGA